MMEFSLWKNLKKQLRRKRRPTWSLGGLLPLLLAGGLMLTQGELAEAAPQVAGIESVINKLELGKEPLSVELRRIYVCGEESKPLGRMMGKQVASLLQSHPDWTAVLDQTNSIVHVEQRVEDLSEHCKANAYMGVDKLGNFSLYDGIPKKEKVVRTFFQLDVHYMESSLPQDKLDQLTKGIRINDIEEFNSVLSTFSDYAIEQNQKVMKPAY
ncbi:BofC C-terminal domain-containing protein [Paenibacillus sinopodophylli]|uniref:BofC C-terminal domain-containing protein n=1 Tax=Paenibacillus sinopodophylli TaxID=1837342 RepID=UPI00110C9405|nr:BofC C-terminal domain-containing protein [Paenibacillus sinopodophylli]